MSTQEKKGIESISVEAVSLIRMLEEVPIGEVIPYHRLTARIGRDVQAEARGLLNTARNRLRADQSIVFQAVRGEGLKRCNDVEKVEVGGAFLEKSRRAARKSQQALTSVDDYSKLPREVQVEHNMRLSQAGVVLHFTGGKAEKTIAKAIENTNGVLPPMLMMEAFKRS